MTDNNLYEIQNDNASDGADSDNILSQLRGVIGKKVKRNDIFISVPERPGVQLLVSPNITQNQIKAWQKNCGSDSKNGIDATKFACTVIGNCTRKSMCSRCI